MKQQTTLTLAPAAASPPGLRERLSRCIPAMLLLAALWTVLMRFAAPAEAVWILPAALSALICGASCLLPERGWAPWARMGTLGALLAAALIGKSAFSAGLTLCRNVWRLERTAATGILHPALPTAGEGSTLLCFLVLGGTAALLCREIVCRAPLAGSLACFAGGAALAVLTDPGTPSPALAVLPAAGILLLVLRDRESGPALGSMLAALLAGGIALGAAWCVPAVRTGSVFSAWREAAADRLHTLRYESGGDPLPEGKLASVAPRTETGRVMLTVTADRAEALYLRGFTGTDYTGTGWSARTGEALARDGETLWWLHLEGFYPQTQTALAADAAGAETDMLTLTVTNNAACSKYAYLPAGTVGESLEQEALRLDDGSFDGGGSRGTLTVRVLSHAAEQSAAWVAALRDGTGERRDAFLRQESVYRALVEASALAVPEGVRERLLPLLKEAGWTEESTAAESIAAVRAMLDEHFDYSDGGLTLPAGADLAETLLERGTGGDVHYATLAALALRCCGVPARYAEGYVLTAEQAETAEGGSIALRDDSAHAWAEIYQPGLGWLPLELTPGYVSSMGTAGQAGGASGMSPDETGDALAGVGADDAREGEEYDPDPEQNADLSPDPGETPDASENSQTRLPRRRVLWLLLIPLALLLAAAWLVLRRERVLRARRMAFADGELSPALAARYAYCIRLLEELGFDRAGGSLLALAPPLEARFGAAYAARYRRMTAVQQEAVFSSHALSAERREEMAAFSDETAGLLRENTGFWTGLRQKWLKCLY